MTDDPYDTSDQAVGGDTANSATMDARIGEAEDATPSSEQALQDRVQALEAEVKATEQAKLAQLQAEQAAAQPPIDDQHADNPKPAEPTGANTPAETPAQTDTTIGASGPVEGKEQPGPIEGEQPRPGGERGLY